MGSVVLPIATVPEKIACWALVIRNPLLPFVLKTIELFDSSWVLPIVFFTLNIVSLFVKNPSVAFSVPVL